MYMKSADLFAIAFYILIFLIAYDTNINHRYKILFNLWVRINYIYLNFTTKLYKNFITVKMWMSMSNRSVIIVYMKYHLQLRK